MVSPKVQMMPPAKLRSEADTPADPCAIGVVPFEAVQMRQYPAVPAFPVAAEVIALIVNTPVVTVPMGLDIGRDANKVPLAPVPQFAGCEPV